MSSGEIPNLILPTRSKNNIEYNEDSCVWVYGNSESTRSAKSVRGAYRLLKTVYTIDFLNYQLKGGKSSTLRELYYISEGWDLAKFGAQEESNKLIEDLEIMSDLQRENFHIRPYFYLDLCNYSNTSLNFKIHERAEGEIISYEPDAKIVDSPAGEYLVWRFK
ncbi:MAG: Type 2 DNA topoisomerase 6 subunit A [Candidatus Methanolliviera sp. GoM_oil]|nr:MAG: Type 2 DNA topoisomerase 6 subunit A [Candidatus Methanolliviera sp. GoM_oil]